MGIISATALLPRGFGVRKSGIEISPNMKSANVNPPKVLSDDFKNAIPMRRRERLIMKKKTTEKNLCGVPVVSGNIPTPIKAHVVRRRDMVPALPKIVFNNPLFLSPIAKKIPRIPATMSPALKRIEEIPCAAQIGSSPGKPPRSESQLVVQLNQGE